ncbi:MAG: hypothetical protein ACOC1E_00245 [Marinilabiliaceae bacterium]
MAFLVLFSIGTINIHAQEDKNQSELQERWKRFRDSDDNEKDFRAGSFLQYMENALKEGVSGTDSAGLLEGWESDTISGGEYSVHASYISFNDRADRVFYCLHQHDENEVFALSHELSKKYKDHRVVPRLDYTDEVEEGIALSLSTGNHSILSVPGVQALILIEKLSRSRGDQDSFDISDSLSSRMKKLMEAPSLFENDFSGYPGVSTLLSPDKRLKTVTWNVEDLNGTHHFYGIMAVRQDDSLIVKELNDGRNDIETPESMELDASNWYGAIYYEIVPSKYQGETGYTVLGYNGKDSYSQERIIDFIRVSSGGDLYFGAPVFDYQGQRRQRLIFEYSNQANMMLRYDEQDDRIVMDHLAPRSPRYEGDRSYYGPDFSYDALKFDGEKWVLIEDVDVRNR